MCVPFGWDNHFDYGFGQSLFVNSNQIVIYYKVSICTDETLQDTYSIENDDGIHGQCNEGRATQLHHYSQSLKMLSSSSTGPGS